MAASLFFLPFPTAFTSNGLPAAGAKASFYLTGTLTPRDTFTTSALTTAHPNPVMADAAGRLPNIYLDTAVTYRLIIKDAAGATLADIDPYIPGTTANAALLTPYQTNAAASATAAGVSEANAAAAATNAANAAVATAIANLADASGTFVQSGTGAVVRSTQNRLRDTVSVKDFGAVGDGVANDTTKIQAAIDSLGTTGGAVFFPKGTYLITASLNIPNEGISLIGLSRWKTIIQQSTLTAGIINATGMFFNLSGIGLTYSGVPGAGAVAIYSQGSYSHFNDFVVLKAETGVYLKTGVAQKLTNFEILDYETIGLRLEGLNDPFVSKFIINAGNTTRGALGGIRLVDKVEALVCCDGDVLLGAFSMTTTAVTNGVGTRPAYNKFSNVYFDSSTNGVSIDKVVEFDFTSCWFSNRPNSGIVLGITDGVRFHGGGAINCGQNGLIIGAASVRTVVNGFAARGNSAGTANTYDGIAVAAGATDFLITNCILGGAIGFGSQRNGVFVNAGASDRYVIADNLVTGNTTGGVSDGGTGVNKRVANNY